MSDERPRTIFADATQSRFFWIPDDETLAEGSLVLRTLTGTRREVDAAAAAAFEIPEDQAKRLVMQQMSGYAKAAARVAAGAGRVLQQVADAQKVAAERPPADRSNEQLVADTLGITQQQLRNDPDAVIAGLQKVGAGLRKMVRDAIDDRDPEAQEHVRERMKIIAGIVGDEGGDPSTLDDAPEKIRDFLSNPELEGKVRDLTAKLAETIAEMKASSSSDA